MGKKILFSFELEPGMIVAEDVFRSNGALLFPKHTMLNDMMISRLPHYNIDTLPILDGPVEAPKIDIEKLVALAKEAAAAKEAAKNSSYSQKIKASDEFKEFSQKYTDTVSQVNKKLVAFTSEPESVEVHDMVTDTLDLMQGTTIHIFDMLHNIESNDDSIYEHSTNVAIISATIGKWLNLEEADIKNLILAGLLHDIGKTQIDTSILNKPDKLTDSEFTEIKTHPQKSYASLKSVIIDERIKQACLLHHERCDGSGYPMGLRSDKIPLYAKILAIADVYDAMTSPRSYRKALCPFKVIQVFEQDGFNKYDPKIIMTFLENIGAAYINNKVLLSDGRIGEIVMLNKQQLSRPMIKCDDEFIDLTKNTELTIESII